jgi:hypothetical protein
MRVATERRLLQGAVALACLVPLGAGGLGVIEGAGFLRGVGVPAVDLDSHVRYLSGVLLTIGLAFASCVPRIATQSPRFRLLGWLVIGGGCARLASWVVMGAPSAGHRFGLAMELGVVPLLMLWQARVTRRAG